MIYLNENLEILNRNLCKTSRLCKKIISQGTISAIKIISQLDYHKKGFLLPNQICPNAEEDCITFIREIFGQRIPYSTLLSYFQHICTDNSSETNESTAFFPQNITELVMLEYENAKKKQLIRRDIGKYIIQKQGKIGYTQFEDYCHYQKLRVNPKVIFCIVSQNKQYIEVEKSTTELKKPKRGITLTETEQKIGRAQKNIKRLLQRVDKFGSQWL